MLYNAAGNCACMRKPAGPVAGDLPTRNTSGAYAVSDDPIVEVVRRDREKYAASFYYDVHAMAADLRRQQEREGRKSVGRPPRRPDLPTEATKKAG